MDCPICGHPNRSGARFCGGCSAALVGSRICPGFRASNPASQRFCDAGGGELNTLRGEQGLSLSVPMGLNSGEVVVGAIGDDLDMAHTAIGQTVGLARRMEQLAERGRVSLSAEDQQLVVG